MEKGIYMEQPFLTIGIASYNYSKYLDKALEQIKKQSFKNFEILYCDDGSTDESVNKIKQIINQEQDMNIRLVEGSHKGLLENKNRILNHAKGEYLLICDADDYMLDGCLDKLCMAAKASNADCIIGGFQEITDEGKVLKKHVPTKNTSKWLYTWHHAQIYKMNIIRKYGICFEQIPDDVFYLQDIHQHCSNVVFVSECLYSWCRHKESTSNNYSLNKEWNPVQLWAKIAPYIGVLQSGLEIEDRKQLDYYLYKWYYFNITDLWKEDFKHIRLDVNIMREQMQRVNPEYLNYRNISTIAKAGDSRFARCAVAGCWLLEKMRMIYVVVAARKIQRMMRR